MKKEKRRIDRYYRSNNNVYFACHFHIVWCPKYRKRVLINGIEQRLEQIIRGVCQERQAFIVALKVMPDHVHLLVSVDPQFGAHQLVKLIKGRSSFLLRKEYPHLKKMPSLWTNSYFISTVGKPTMNVVKHYIENQKDA